MASPSTSGSNAPPLRRHGFTLIEILIAMAIIAIIFAAGLPVVWEFYRTSELDAERDTVAALLRLARTQSMANKNETDHGVFVASENFILFEGIAYASRNTNQDKLFPRSIFVNATGTSEIIFASLSGRSASSTITLSVDSVIRHIGVNAEGRVE